MRHRLLLAAIVLAAASSTAFAGVVITSTQVNLATKEDKRDQRLYRSRPAEDRNAGNHGDLSRRSEQDLGDRDPGSPPMWRSRPRS